MLVVPGPHLQKPWFSQTPSVGIWFISVPFELVVGCWLSMDEKRWRGWERDVGKAITSGLCLKEKSLPLDLWVVAKPFMEISREASGLTGESSV